MIKHLLSDGENSIKLVVFRIKIDYELIDID